MIAGLRVAALPVRSGLSRRPGATSADGRLVRRYLRRVTLAFDIGSHVGDRISSFRRLGARVVALEPQPGPAPIIRLIHGRDSLGRRAGSAAGAAGRGTRLRVNSRNPTVSSLSADFVSAAQGARGWEGQEWKTLKVPVTTFLIA